MRAKIYKDNLNILILVSIGMLILSIAKEPFGFEIPYGFFTFLRWIITICSAWIGYRIFNVNSKSTWLILFGLIAILFNPIAPIQFEREIWTGIDIIVGIILFTYLFKSQKAEGRQ